MVIDPARYESYVSHAFTLNEYELEIRGQVLPLLPDTITDSHTHAATPEAFNPSEIPDHIQRHMMSTFPGFTIEQSRQADELLFPGKYMRKVRFSHIFPNIDKRRTNSYLKESASDKDIPVLFGLSDSEEDVEYTIAQLETGDFRGLKMYYLASEPPKYSLYEYFPKPILQTAEQMDTPIILHLPHSLYGSEGEIHKIAEDFPSLRVILAHIGVANVPKKGLDGILGRFAAHPNIYADTALVDVEDIVLKALQHFGPRRVLYGSDEPLNLLRTMTYFNPELHTARVLTDFDYHWADAAEQDRYRHMGDKPFVHNHWLQIQALIGSLAATSSSQNLDTNMGYVFNDNAQSVFNL